MGEVEAIDLELDTSDLEPRFGWGNNLNQAMIATENTFDTDDREDEGDAEPSMGWSNPMPGADLPRGWGDTRLGQDGDHDGG